MERREGIEGQSQRGGEGTNGGGHGAIGAFRLGARLY